MTFEVLVFPEGKSDVSGYTYPRHALASFVARQEHAVYVVSRFSETGYLVNLENAIGQIDNFLLKEGGVYANLKFLDTVAFRPLQSLIEDRGSPKVRPAFIGRFANINGDLTVETIELLIEVSLVLE